MILTPLTGVGHNASNVTTTFRVRVVAAKVDNAVIGRRATLAPYLRPTGM
jgi:hypothetical protein